MIAIIGLELFSKRIAGALNKLGINAEFIDEKSLGYFKLKRKLKNHTTVHFVFSPTISKKGVRTLIYCRLLKKKIIVNWVGTDVLIATKKPLWKFVTKMFKGMIDLNIATASNLVEELKEIGIDAKYQPIPVYSLYEIQELPKENKIAVYLPDKTKRDWDFYQGDLIKKIIKEFPNVEFIIVSNSGKSFDEKNVKCIKWIDDMKEVYSSVKAVIRLPIHDGTSGTLIETLSMGRTMIVSIETVPYCKIANNFEELKGHISAIITNKSLNTEASDYVHMSFYPEKLTKELISIYNSLNN